MADIAVQLGEALHDRYVIERELGRGGMATVYLARDLKHDRLVALKVLHPGLAAALGPERFLREIRLTARLDHPHILSAFDSGKVRGSLQAASYAFAPAWRRLAELYEERGQRAEAIDAYSRFAALWKDAGPALQPAVRGVRQRMAALAGEHWNGSRSSKRLGYYRPERAARSEP